MIIACCVNLYHVTNVRIEIDLAMEFDTWIHVTIIIRDIVFWVRVWYVGFLSSKGKVDHFAY